jgi:hypothetical protein
MQDSVAAGPYLTSNIFKTLGYIFYHNLDIGSLEYRLRQSIQESHLVYLIQNLPGTFNQFGNRAKWNPHTFTIG